MFGCCGICCSEIGCPGCSEPYLSKFPQNQIPITSTTLNIPPPSTPTKSTILIIPLPSIPTPSTSTPSTSTSSTIPATYQLQLHYLQKHWILYRILRYIGTLFLAKILIILTVVLIFGGVYLPQNTVIGTVSGIVGTALIIMDWNFWLYTKSKKTKLWEISLIIYKTKMAFWEFPGYYYWRKKIQDIMIRISEKN